MSATIAVVACAQPAALPTSAANSTAGPIRIIEGKRVATELPVEVKQLIDAARRLNEEPGLILGREEIFKVVGARSTLGKRTKYRQGKDSLSEPFLAQGPLAAPIWQGELIYTDHPDSASWTVRIEFIYSHGPACYTSRLVEAYWGKPFVYRPFGVHEQLREMIRPEGDPPTGPHDGRPYNAAFSAAHENSTNVFFGIGRGGCLVDVTISGLFKHREYSDENIYYE